MSIAELQTPDTFMQSDYWLAPSLPAQQAGQHDILSQTVQPPDCSVTDRQVRALRDWCERGEHLDHLTSLIVHKGYSMSFDNFATQERLAQETVPFFDEIVGSAFDETFPNGLEEPFEPHSGSLADVLAPDTPADIAWPLNAHEDHIRPPREPDTEIVAPVTPEPATEIIKPIVPVAARLGAMLRDEGRHVLRRPAPAEPQPIPFEPPNQPKSDPEKAITARKLNTRHIGAAAMRLVRRLGFVIPRKSQAARLANS